MFNLKNITQEVEEIYLEGYSRFKRKIKNLEPNIDDMPMTLLQRLKTRIYHLGFRLQEISSFPYELIRAEQIMLHVAMKDYASIFESYYPLPNKIRRKIYVEMSRSANLFAKSKGLIFKKYFSQPIGADQIDKIGKKLVALSFQLYDWHLKFEKNRDESASGSSSL